MKIVYYTAGTTGMGRLVLGIALHNALLRTGRSFEYTILHSAPDSAILRNCEHFYLPLESPRQTDSTHYKFSSVYTALENLSPDILIVDLLWQPLRSFISLLSCRKFFLCRQIAERFFSYDDGIYKFSFEPEAYDNVLAIEPFPCQVTEKHINPVILRNKNELLSREDACEKLGLNTDDKNCLFSCNLTKDILYDTQKEYAYLEDEGYTMFYSSLFAEGIFPVIDYFNAFDKVVCAAGYSAFWEARYFNKDAIFVPQEKVFEDQWQRIRECASFSFEENGADQLVRLILDN